MQRQTGQQQSTCCACLQHVSAYALAYVQELKPVDVLDAKADKSTAALVAQIQHLQAAVAELRSQQHQVCIIKQS